jgi:hypothetical protein
MDPIPQLSNFQLQRQRCISLEHFLNREFFYSKNAIGCVVNFTTLAL